MTKGSHREIQEQILNKLLLVLSFVATPVVIASLSRYFQIGWQSAYIVHIVAAVIVICFAIYRKVINYNLKAIYLIAILIVLAINGYIALELNSYFRTFLVLAVFIATIFLGRKYAIFLYILSAIIIIILGILKMQGKISASIDHKLYGELFTTWISMLVTFLLLSALIIITSGKIGYLLASKISQLQKTHEELEQTKLQLDIKNNALKIKNKELTEINATKDKFFRIIGHDLKSPISHMIQFSTLIEQKYTELQNDEILKFIKAMKESSIRGFKLLDNLLEWSRSQTGQIEFEPEFTSFYNLVQENIDIINYDTEIKNIKIYNEVNKDIEINVDKNMINTVIRNLLSNAIKFSYPGGNIKILSKHTNDHFEFAVKDNGKGISNDNCNKLFKIETGLSTLGTNNEKGTGIGLVLCKEFIDKHEGEIWVESEIEKGSTFYFTIPIKKKLLE